MTKSPYEQLRALEAKYARQLASAKPSIDAIRRTREQIIKLKFDLGIS